MKSNVTRFCDSFIKEDIIKKFGPNMDLMEHYIFKETKFKNDKGLIVGVLDLLATHFCGIQLMVMEL